MFEGGEALNASSYFCKGGEVEERVMMKVCKWECGE